MKRSSESRMNRSLPLRAAFCTDVRYRLLAQPVLELLEVEAARLDVLADDVPRRIRALERRLVLLADEADDPRVGGGRALRDHRALAVPGDVIRAAPAVAGAHPLAVLDGNLRLARVVQPADGPPVVRLAVAVILLRRAV